MFWYFFLTITSSRDKSKFWQTNVVMNVFAVTDPSQNQWTCSTTNGEVNNKACDPLLIVDVIANQ